MNSPAIPAMNLFGALQLVQQDFSLLRLNSQFYIIDEIELKNYRNGFKADVSLFDKQNGRILIERYLTNQPVACIPSQIFLEFIKNNQTHVYNEIKFHPLNPNKDVLNLWVPPTIEPIDTPCPTIDDFLFDIIANQDQVIYDYLIHYLAHLYQKPEEKPGIMVALMSAQGCGKGVFMDMLRMIWSRTTIMINDIEQITGRFNLSLERHLIVCLDEAMYVNDNAGQEKLKNLITEPYIQVEAKHQTPRTVNSLHRFFLATNHEHFLKTTKDDRRLFAIPISEYRQNDSVYFSNLINKMKHSDELNGFVYKLSQINLSNFNIRNRPKTAIHAMQIIRSLQGVDRWVYEILNNKTIGYSHSSWQEAFFISMDNLKREYKNFNPQAEKYKTLQSDEIKLSFKKLIPGAIETRTSQARGFRLPDIQLARIDFEAIVGMQIDWDVA